MNNDFYQLSEIIFFGNSLLIWLYFAGITLGLFFIFLMTRHSLIKHFNQNALQTETLIDDLALALTQTTRKLYLFIFALFLGLFLIKLPPSGITMKKKLFLLLTLLQFLAWGGMLIRFWTNHYLKKRAESDAVSASAIGLITFGAKFGLYSMLLLIALTNIGVDISALITGLGVGGIAIALAAQNILGDLFASLTIILDKPFMVGETIHVGEFIGTVEYIGLKTTRLKSLSGEQLIFSNADLLKNSIRNYKRMNERRMVFTLNLIYQTPVETLKKIPTLIQNIINKHSQTRFERSHFRTFSASSLDIETVYWVTVPEIQTAFDLQQAINLEIMKQFEKENIQFAYPTQTVFLEKNYS